MSKEQNKLKGNFGEDLACMYLKNFNYKILDRNFNSSFGEIDIIAIDKDEIVFIEVKTRFQNAFGSPDEAIDLNKKVHLYNSALYYLYSHNISNYSIRFDIIAIQVQNDSHSISHIKNIITDYPNSSLKRRF